MTGPWTNAQIHTTSPGTTWHYDTVEAAPDVDDLTDKLESARRFAVVFEGRLERVRQLLVDRDCTANGASTCPGCNALALLALPLGEGQ